MFDGGGEDDCDGDEGKWLFFGESRVFLIHVFLFFFPQDVKERSEQLADRYVPLTKEQTADFKSATKLVTLLRTMMEVGSS
jgi:hypothetical protein